MSDSTATCDARFAALDSKPSPPPPPGGKVHQVLRDGDLVVMSGQIAMVDSELLATGRLGDNVDLDTGRACARQCAINLLGRLQEELGSLDDVAQVVKLTIFVASASGFREQHLVAHGATDLFVEVLGEKGKHARSAVGVAELPLGTPVEVEATLRTR